MDFNETWDDLRRCVAYFDLRGITDDDVEDILSQKFQMLDARHKEETYDCLDAIPTSKLERTAECFATILNFIKKDSSAADVFWEKLSGVTKRRFMHRIMLATIDLCMSRVSALAKVAGHNPNEDQSPLSKGLLAANIYIMWLQIPGGSAYGVFMPFVYQDAMWVLLTWAKFMYAPEIEEESTTTAPSGQTKRKQSKKAVAQTFSSTSEVSTYGLDVLDALISLQSETFFDHDVVVTTLDAMFSIAALMAVQDEPVPACRDILLPLYRNHSQLVLARFIPGLALRYKLIPSGSWDKVKHMTIYHNWALKTTDELLRQETQSCDENVLCILQQLCILSPEKTEDRKRVVAALVLLFRHHVLPHNDRTSIFVDFLDSFSRSDKVSCRQFAIETFTQLILNDKWVDKFSIMFKVLFERSRDKSVWVRTKAMAGLTSVLSKGLHKSATQSNILEKMVTEELTSSKEFFGKSSSRVWVQVIELLKERLEDEKKLVRKAALQVLEVLLVVELDMSIVGEIQLKCTDTSILVRKQAMQVLTTLLIKYPTNRELQNVWNWGVLPLVNDPENVVQANCVDLVQEIFFARLVKWYDHRSKGQTIPPSIASVHEQFALLDRMLLGFFQVGTRLLAKGIQDEVAESSSWVILDELSSHLLDNVTKADCSILTKLWQTNQNKSEHTLRMLRVISAVAPRVSALDASKIAAGVEKSLRCFGFQMNVISGAIEALSRLKKKDDWSEALWFACDAVIKETSEKGFDNISELQKALCTMGDLWKSNEGNNLRLQSIQRFLLPQLNDSKTPPEVRAIAFLALGKVSLANQVIAKQSMTMFIRELQTSDNVAIRSNILLILGDLCMQYTSMVEVYVPTIAACFLKPNLLLRRNVLLMLTQLILQGYIKWKDSLLHYFLHLVVDDNADLAHLARHVLSTSLLQKTPNLFTTKFVETIFVLNNTNMPAVSATHSLPLASDELAALSLPGPDKFPKRWKIYQFMLNTMSDFQKVDVTGKITRGILEEVSEQKLPLHANPSEISVNSVERVMQDALLVLSCPEIKLNVRDSTSGDDEDEQEPSSMKEATRNLASKLSKKNLMVNVIPVLIGVKHQLEAKRSPVMRYLLHYLQDLMVSYKDEVTDVLNTDPQLAKEIAFDLKQYKASQITKTRLSLGGTSLNTSTASAGVAATPQLKKYMTPLTRMLRQRKSSMDDSSDDEGITQKLDFLNHPQQQTPQRHVKAVVEPQPVPIEEEEESEDTSNDSDFEEVPIKKKPVASKSKRVRK
ncbi:hypothetical protein Ae201684_002679 [Aphanomyces euteiches]|uniref:Condensin complex subunit 1 C-terminal domain-containing protein n=1 Tax=Aphanomyces euteiches TaxID=100861 RepID=A0A6G0XPB5_9STRA|nr:hypothetical protein Ae201684_002679 [Aphanomyces euteiches]